jgi:hypothetical protein
LLPCDISMYVCIITWFGSSSFSLLSTIIPFL